MIIVQQGNHRVTPPLHISYWILRKTVSHGKPMLKFPKNEFEKVINSKDAFWINFNMNLATFWVLGVKFLKIRRKKCPDRQLTDGYGVLFIIYLVFGLIWEIGSVWLILISLFHANLLSLSKFQWTEYFLNFRWFGLIRPHPLMTHPIIIKTSIQQTV